MHKHIVILDANSLEDTKALTQVLGLMIKGYQLSQKVINQKLQQNAQNASKN